MKLLKSIERKVYGDINELESWINEEVLQQVGGYHLTLVDSELIPNNQFVFWYKDSFGYPFKLLATETKDGEWFTIAYSFEI